MHWIVLIAIFFAGCASKGPEIYTSVRECPLHEPRDLGVYEVELPDYFIDDRFVYKDGTRLGYLSERFAADPEQLFTRCAVRMLGGCLYPWECQKRPRKVVKIEIEDFFYDKRNKQIYISALIDKRRAKVWLPVRGDVITSAMEAFRKLLERQVDLLK